MKITIELTDAEVASITSWASVSRTLTESISQLDNYLAHHSDWREEAITYNIHELEQVCPMVDSLHHRVRAAIWEKQRKDHDEENT